MPAILPDYQSCFKLARRRGPAQLHEVETSALGAWTRALENTASIVRRPSLTLPVLIEALGDKFGTAPALISEHETLSYRALAARSNYYAIWAIQQKLAGGDVVCLLMNNRPEYFAIWLGITKVGATVSLLNTHLLGTSLEHCIRTVDPQHLIVDTNFAERLTAILPQLPSTIKLWIHGGSAEGFRRIDNEARCDSNPRQICEFLLPNLSDRALYIYTSGTTGLPKAASVSHFRLMQWSQWFAGMMDTRPDDRMYNCLPMYHSVGGVVAIGAVLVNGGSVVLRDKFSVGSFWDDIVQWRCTLFQYIGELCRYLVNSRPHPCENGHRIRLCCGNGLSPTIWSEFQRRFQIPQILEFYGATEGTFSLYNCEGKPGSIGRIPPYLEHRFPMALVKFDYDRCEPLRNDNGFCIRCAPDEIGEAIGRIAERGSSTAGQFEGYSDPVASEAKLLRNVFVTGDVWYRTGDLMRRDKRGFFYFVDRVGDTFRWKGENVSTTEVTDIISECPGVNHAVVYGVIIPGAEGRAGMATLVVDDLFDIEFFHRYLAERLPHYARPHFVRLAKGLPVTSTLKLQKQELSRQGFDPSAGADPMYFNDPVNQSFVTIDSQLYERILVGQIRI